VEIVSKVSFHVVVAIRESAQECRSAFRAADVWLDTSAFSRGRAADNIDPSNALIEVTTGAGANSFAQCHSTLDESSFFAKNFLAVIPER
jgi:hypothetical protein